MPVVRNYRVTQTWEVNVRANNPVDAVRIAGGAFNPDQSDEAIDVYGDTTSDVRATDISAYEQ